MTKPESTLRNKSRAENPSRESHNLGESLDYSGAGFSGDGLFESIGQYGLAIGLALSVLVLALRFAPLPENFSGFGALAIFCGLFGKGFQRWLIPLLTLFAADCIGHFGHIRGMGFYAPQTMLLNYLGFAVMTGIGAIASNSLCTVSIFGKAKWLVLPISALVGSACFFLISNFGAWLDPMMGYAKTAVGLMDCYLAGLPFWRATLTSDVIFTLLYTAFAAVLVPAFRFQRRIA